MEKTEERQYKVGNEVWVKATLFAVQEDGADVLPVVPGVADPRKTWPTWALDLNRGDIRTEADFKDPFNEAIVEAAMAWAGSVANTPLAYGGSVPLRAALIDAVQAKLEAAKPKTAEQIIEPIIWGGGEVKAKAVEVAVALRDAGLLREDSE